MPDRDTLRMQAQLGAHSDRPAPTNPTNLARPARPGEVWFDFIEQSKPGAPWKSLSGSGSGSGSGSSTNSIRFESLSDGSIVLRGLDRYTAYRFRLVSIPSMGGRVYGVASPPLLTDAVEPSLRRPPAVEAHGSASFSVSWVGHTSESSLLRPLHTPLPRVHSILQPYAPATYSVPRLVTLTLSPQSSPGGPSCIFNPQPVNTIHQSSAYHLNPHQVGQASHCRPQLQWYLEYRRRGESHWSAVP